MLFQILLTRSGLTRLAPSAEIQAMRCPCAVFSGCTPTNSVGHEYLMCSMICLLRTKHLTNSRNFPGEPLLNEIILIIRNLLE